MILDLSGSKEIAWEPELFFLRRQNFAPVTGCCSHFQAPAGSEPASQCSYFTVASNYTPNSGVIKTYFLPQIDTQIVSWVHIMMKPWWLLFFPCVAFLWKECVWVEVNLWCISADPLLDQRYRFSGHSILHPRAPLPKMHIQQQSDGFHEGLLILRVKSLPLSSASSRRACVLPIEAGYNEQKVLRKAVWERSCEYSLFIVKIRCHWKTNVSRCWLEWRMK